MCNRKIVTVQEVLIKPLNVEEVWEDIFFKISLYVSDWIIEKFNQVNMCHFIEGNNSVVFAPICRLILAEKQLANTFILSCSSGLYNASIILSAVESNSTRFLEFLTFMGKAQATTLHAWVYFIGNNRFFRQSWSIKSKTHGILQQSEARNAIKSEWLAKSAQPVEQFYCWEQC